LRIVVPAAALLWSSAALAQTTVRGTVRSDQGGVITGASVSIPALGVGSTSRTDGSYSFTIPAARATGQSARLVARFVGFSPESVTVTLSGDVTHDFTLKVNPLRLGEVVVTGAGTETTRERLGNVINTVDSTVLARASEPQNVVSALAGKIPNVDIRTQAGDPGSSASIKIRGATSVLGTNQPLFVVDGQPIDNSTVSVSGGDGSTVTQNRAADINPNDIESVDILMGSAAAAIYGARAANGVVLITTKKGSAGPTRYTLSSTSSFDMVDPNVKLQTTYGQGDLGVLSSCSGPDCSATSLTWGGALPAGTPVYNHVKDIYRTGTTFDNILSASGGNERTTFYLSGGSTNQQGVMKGPNNFYDRNTVRLKGTHQLFDQLEVGGNFSYINTQGRYVQKGSNTSGLLLGSLRTPPNFNNEVYLDPSSGLHRSYRFPNPTAASLTTPRGYDNPFFTLNNPGNTSELGRFIGNINLDYRPNDWLRIQETVGADHYSDGRRESLPLTSSGEPDGAVARYDITNLEIDHNLLVSATRTFNNDFNGTLTLGQNLNSRKNRQLFVQGITLNAPEPLAVQNTLFWTPSEFQSTRHIEGYFGEATANLYNQLYLTAGLRRDGFSTFGASTPTAWFPKASAAWTFSNYFGWDRSSPINFGKLRLAYGETGREPPVYATISALNSTALFGSGFQDFINVSQSGNGGLVTDPAQGNSNLRPERSKELEGGFDLSFFGQRADLGVTAYNKKSSDVILLVPVNASQTGSTNALSNGATISNHGLEITLNTRPYTSENFAWEIGGNFGRNRNNVDDLQGAEFVPYNNEGFTGSIGSSSVGYPVGVIRGSDFARCGRGLKIVISGVLTDIDQSCAATGGVDGALFLAANGQPIGDPTDRVIADPNPKWTAGINSSVRLMNRLTLSGLLDIRHGGQVWNGTRGALYRFGTHEDTEIRSSTDGQFGVNFLTDVYPNVAGPGAGKVAFTTPAQWEAWFTGNGGSASNYQYQFIEDGSFVKLRELSAAMSFNNDWVRNRLGFSNVDLRLTGRNLITWTNYRGLDPEANLGGAEFLTQGFDFFNNPTTRSFIISLGLNR
jgi:TonB-linked SusC/RagA family outer membrane protein